MLLLTSSKGFNAKITCTCILGFTPMVTEILRNIVPVNEYGIFLPFTLFKYISKVYFKLVRTDQYWLTVNTSWKFLQSLKMGFFNQNIRMTEGYVQCVL